MFRNFLKTTSRSLVKNKSYTLMNIAGLALGIVCALVIFLIIEFEYSFDTYHQNFENIYRIVTEADPFGKIVHETGVAYPLPAAMRTDFPEIEHLTIVDSNFGPPVISVENRGTISRFKEEDTRAAFVNPDYFKIFTYEWLMGDIEEALQRPKSAVISEGLARKYFDNANPMGRTIKFDNSLDLQVTGVVRDVPDNTDLPFEILMSYDRAYTGSDNWGSVSTSVQCYLSLPPNIPPSRIEARLHEFLSTHRSKDVADKHTLRLQPLSQVHFDTRFQNYRFRTVSRESLLALSLIAIFLLGTACINFINLNTALAVKRSKEVGVRKVLGSSKKQLVAHFLSETASITFLAILLSLPLTELAIINLSSLLGFELPFNPLHDLSLLAFLLVLFVTVTLIAGFYPALYLSGFRPIEAIRNKISTSYGEGISLRRGLVVLQFAISQVLIVSTIVISSQIKYFSTLDLGFNKDAIVEVALPTNEQSKLVRLKSELLRHPPIKRVSLSSTGTASGNTWSGDYEFKETDQVREGKAQVKFADQDFIDTYELKMLFGEDLAESDTLQRFVVNQAFVKDVGYDENYGEVIGKFVKIWGREAPIEGVVRDFTITSLHRDIEPVIILMQNRFWQAGIKINLKEISEALATIEQVWSSVYPEYVFDYSFLDENIEAFYEQERKTAYLINTFTLIAILIGCMGLFGLVSYMAAQRTKEIGVRKVLGASFANILSLFSKEFALLIALAFVLAAPLAYFFMSSWLEEFAYRVDLGPGMFLLALLASCLIAFLTVGYKSVQAAIANPVDSLRSE